MNTEILQKLKNDAIRLTKMTLNSKKSATKSENFTFLIQIWRNKSARYRHSASKRKIKTLQHINSSLVCQVKVSVIKEINPRDLRTGTCHPKGSALGTVHLVRGVIFVIWFQRYHCEENEKKFREKVPV